MNWKQNIILGFILACTFQMHAQFINPSILNIESGLSTNYVRTIFKDGQGMMWFGTDTGLDSFDGLQIVNYAKRFRSPLKGAVQSIAEIREGLLVVGTTWGAFLYDVRQNRITPIEFESPTLDVRKVLITTDEVVYFATEKGFYELLGKRAQAVPVKFQDKAVLSLCCMLEDAHGMIWVAGSEGLFKLNSEKVLVPELTIPNINELKCMGNSIFLGTLQGLIRYDVQNKRSQVVKALNGTPVISLTADLLGNLFVGTDNAGVFKLEPKSMGIFRFIPLADYASKTVSALYYDDSGMLWMGTFDGGVHYLNLQTNIKFRTVEFENSANGNVRSMYISPQGDRFIGTRHGTLLCLDSSHNMKSAIDNHQLFRSNILTTIFPFPGKPGRLLIGTFGGGITVFDMKHSKCSDFSSDKTFQSGTFYKFCTDKQSRLWMATLDGLIKYDFQSRSFVRFNSTSVCGSNEVFSLHSDGNDKIWIGTKTGAAYYSLSGKKFVQPEACKSHRFQCTAIFVDSKGNSWFCFNKGGVLKLDQNQRELLWLTKEIGLPQNAPSSLLEDRSGNIWIGTSKGLFKVNGNHEVRAYGLDDGLTGIGFCPQSATLDPNGNLWWSNEKGLVTFLNDPSILNNRIPPVKFTELIVNGSRFDADTLDFIRKTAPDRYSVVIKGKTNNNLGFRFAALNYRFPSHNQYSFLLEGVDKQWSRASLDPMVAFNRLSHGTYLLKIKASNNDGVWTPNAVEIRISIVPYFYESTWFKVLIMLITGGLLLYLTRTYVLRVRKRILLQLDALKIRPTTSSPGIRINEQKSNEIRSKLLAYMLEEKPWLNSDLRQADVAKALGFPVHELSQVLNVQLNQHFSDFINSYRVEEVKVRIQNGETQKYTLTAIALQCGFSAKSSFQRAFKKSTNTTPSDYLKTQGKNSTPDTNSPS